MEQLPSSGSPAEPHNPDEQAATPPSSGCLASTCAWRHEAERIFNDLRDALGAAPGESLLAVAKEVADAAAADIGPDTLLLTALRALKAEQHRADLATTARRNELEEREAAYHSLAAALSWCVEHVTVEGSKKLRAKCPPGQLERAADEVFRELNSLRMLRGNLARDLEVGQDGDFDEAVMRLKGKRDENANARAMMVEVGHALLGCDGHPCRVENGAFTNTDLLEAIKMLRAERDEACEEVERYEEAIDESLPHYRDDEDDEANHIERVECAGKELKVANAKLRTVPPAVAVTDVEKVLNDSRMTSSLGLSLYGLDILREILRDCTRAASVEEVAKALSALDLREFQCTNERLSHDRAREVLRALGVREAEKNATPFDPPEPCVCKHDSAEHATGREGAIDGKCLHRDEVGDWCPCSKFTRAEHENGGAA